MLIQNKSDTEIIDLMVGRYGEFVLYRPRVSSLTYILWFGPALLIFIGIMIVIVILRKKPISKENLALNTDQQTRLEQLLAQSTDNFSTSKSASEQKEKE